MVESLFSVSFQDLVDVVGLVEENEVVLTVPNYRIPQERGPWPPRPSASRAACEAGAGPSYNRSHSASTSPPRSLSSKTPANLSTVVLIPATPRDSLKQRQ